MGQKVVARYVSGANGTCMTAFWQEHQVGGPFADATESTQALLDRHGLFPDLLKLMPVSYPGLTVLDYGCGPGHDTLLFLHHGASRVFFADISWRALKTTSDRLDLHGLRNQAQALFADDDLPQVDHIHCAGVLHHAHDPISILTRLRGALRSGGEANVMVYDGEHSEHSQSDVPITEWWTHAEFVALASEAGWKTKYLGSYPCSSEWRPNCYAACYRLK